MGNKRAFVQIAQKFESTQNKFTERQKIRQNRKKSVVKKFKNLHINISTIIKIKKYLPNYYKNLVYKKSRRTTTKNQKLTWRVRPATGAKKLGIHPWDVQGCLPNSFFWNLSPWRIPPAGFRFITPAVPIAYICIPYVLWFVSCVYLCFPAGHRYFSSTVSLCIASKSFTNCLSPICDATLRSASYTPKQWALYIAFTSFTSVASILNGQWSLYISNTSIML